MKTNINEWLARVFRRRSAAPQKENPFNDELGSAYLEYYIRELAFMSGVNLIANCISKCEFRTYRGGKEIKEREYYLFNVSPNKNQNSSAFIQQWIHTLYRENECLILDVSRFDEKSRRTENQLLVADSFGHDEYALLDDNFSSVTVKDFTFRRTFAASDVLFFRLNNEHVKALTKGIYESYAQMMSAAQKAYMRENGLRATVNFDTLGQGGQPFHEQATEYVKNYLRPFLTSNNAALPIFKGMTYQELQKSASATTRDIRAMIDDVFDITARALSIPPVLMRGDVAGMKDAVDLLLTACVDPLCDMFQEEINRKRNGYEGFARGDTLKIDTTSIKHIDVLSVSTSIDKLIGSGAFSVNDVLRLIGSQEIDEPWANQHWMTKNYAPSNELLNAMGGDGNA